VQNFATGTSGTDFAISSSTATHTFNLPTASATNRGALSTSDWTTFNGKLGASDTVSLSNRINAKLSASDTTSLSNRINTKLNILDANQTLTAYQLLGSSIKAFPIGITSFTNATVALAHSASRMTFVAIYIPQTITVTGVKWISTSAGTSFVPSANYNGFALYSYNIGTGLATRIDTTVNDNTIWSSTGFQSRAFAFPTSLSPGIYYLGGMCNGSATTFPSVSQSAATSTTTVYDFTSPARLTGFVTGSFSPTTFNLSTSTLNSNFPVFSLY